MLHNSLSARARHLAAAALLCPALLGAQQADSLARRTHAQPVPNVPAVPRQGSVVVDGRLDDEAWSRATPTTEFRQYDPDEGQPGSERTEVRFLYDTDALYIGARMFDARGRAGIVTRLVRRDANMDSDYFQVILDTYHDHLGRALFQVNPSNVKQDALGIGGSNLDGSWDGIWESATSIDSLGWTAELRIPYSQLRFSGADEQTWGLQMRRFIHRRNENQQWAFWGKSEPGGPARFGHLEGLRIASVPQHLEVLPYVVARDRRIRPGSTADPFNDGSRQDVRVGGDLKALLTSTLTLDLTINPDFGQVEVDPAVVNLSAFETFFPERRPFFVAGSGVFGFGSFSCMFCSNTSSLESFYSRRIGRAPQLSGLAFGAGPYADVPENSTILGAAKITGRTNGGYTIGLLDAVTRREVAQVSRPDGSLVTQDVEPLSNYLVGRLKRDFRGGDVVAGLIGTSVVRRLTEPAARERLSAHAEALGADVTAFFRNRTYSFRASTELTNVAGDPAAIARVQRAPQRYFQRPDREFGGSSFLTGRYDTTATSLSGLGGYARLGKDAGEWLWESALNFRTPGFETNDIAFQSRADYAWMNVNLARSITKPARWYRDQFMLLGVQQQFNWDGDRNDRQFHLFYGTTYRNFWHNNAFLIRKPSNVDERALRGGPAVRSPGILFFSYFGATDSRARVQLTTNPNIGRTDEGRTSWAADLGVRWLPRSNVSLSVSPRFSHGESNAQFVTSLSDPAATAFFGRRYVLAGLEQNTVSMDTRLAVTFTPTATLELFAQPFVSSQNFVDFKEFAAPRVLEKRVYGRDQGSIAARTNAAGNETGYDVDPDGAGPAASFSLANPDFVLRSLRGNAVLRWEYRPGSTVFFVWTQARADQSPFEGNFDISRDQSALFSARPDNIFLVKLNYWLGR